MRKLLPLVFIFLGMLGCAKPADLLDLQEPKVKEEKQNVGNVRLVFRPQLDILFVVDESGSMSSHQNRLATNISLLTAEIFNNPLLDLHIGVLAGTARSRYKTGELLGTPRFVTRSTPDREERLGDNIKLGTSGDATETVFAPVQNFFNSDLSKPPNVGFYREEGYLALVFITDAKDQSGISAKKLYQDLLDLKKNRADRLIGYGVIVPSNDTTNCQRDSFREKPFEIEEFMDLISLGVGNNTFSLCAPDYGQNLARLGDDLAKRIEMFVPLKQVPAENTLKVKYGTLEIPEDSVVGWSYDASRNGIYLNRGLDLSSQPIGLDLEVTFKPAIFKEAPVGSKGL